MSDAEVILVVLAAIYLWESSCWLRGGAECFTAGRRHFRSARSLTPLENAQGRVVFASLWPSARSLVCHPWPLPLDATGCVVQGYLSARALSTAEPQGKADDAKTPDARICSSAVQQWIPFNNLSEVRADEHSVIIDGQAVAALSSPSAARAIASRLSEIARAGGEQRAAQIAALLDRITDVDAVRSRLSAFDDRARSLRASCAMLSFVGLVVAPIVVAASYWPGLLPWTPLAGWITVGAFSIAWLAVIVSLARSAGALYPNDSRWSRVGRVAMLCLSPASAMRAVEHSSRQLAELTVPWAVALAVCEPQRLPEIVGPTFRALRFPARSGGVPTDKEARDALAWFERQMAERMERQLIAAGLDIDRLLAPPERECDAESYCPRCLGQFIFASGACPDCEVPATPFGISPLLN